MVVANKNIITGCGTYPEHAFDEIVCQAASLAKELHAGQTDKQGVDYYAGHLSAVAAAGLGWKEKVTGYLHDAAEDTVYTVEEVIRMLYERCNGLLHNPDVAEIAEALHLLNSHTVSSRAGYIARLEGNCLALNVKLNDLKHNMDLSRIAYTSDADRQRTMRYRHEYAQILAYLAAIQ